MVETVVQSLRKSVLWMLIITNGVLWADDKLNNLMKDGKFAKAVEYIDKSLPPAKRTVEIWLQYADALEKSGADKQKVLKAFGEAQKVQPSDPQIFATMGEFHLRHKKYQEAIKYLQKWYLLERSAKAAEAMATCAMHLKQYDKARDAAESAVMLDSNAIESRKILSFLYFNNKEWAAAAQQLEAIVVKIKDDVSYWKKLARCYEELNNREKLIVAVARIVNLDNKDIRSRSIMVDYYLQKKDRAAAFSLLKELAVLTPDDAKVFKNLYQISLENNQKKDAVLYLRNFLILDSSNAASYKTLGDLLYEQKNPNEALDAYRKALKLNPSITGIYRPYMAILIEKKLDDEALAVAPKAISANEIDAATYAAVGNIYKKKKRCGNAVVYYQNALKTDVKNLAILSSLAECQASMGKTSEALLNYQQVVMLNPDATAEYKQIGDLLISQKKTDDAMNNYRKYLEKSPADEGIASIVGLHYHSKKQCREALPYFEKIKTPRLLNLSLVTKIGDCYFQTGNYQKAVEYLAKARSQNPSPSALQEILKPLAVSYEKTGLPFEAAKAYEAYVKLPGVKDADASYKQAALRESADRASAITLYQANTANFQEDARSFTRLGILLLEEPKQTKKAIDMLQKASTLAPTDTLVAQKLCDAYHSSGNTSKELTASTKLAALQPDNLIANQRAGSILYKKKQYGQAIPYLEKVTAALPKDIDAALMLADAHLQTKNPLKAMDVYGRAKELQPDNVKIWLSLISAAEAAGQKEKAAEFKGGLAALDKKVVAKDSKAVDARLRLAEYLFAKNDLDASFPLYKELAELTPNDKQVVSRLVEIAQKKGKNADALAYLKQYVTLDANNAKAHVNLGNLYYEQKHFDGALAEYRSALKIDSSLTGFFQKYGEIVITKSLEDEAVTVLNAAIRNNEANQKMFITLGKIYQKRKQYPSAIAMYKKASNNDPKNLAVLSALGECQAASNDIANAVVTYEQVVLLNPQANAEYKALGDLQMRQNKTDNAIKSYRKYLEKSVHDDTIARTVGMHMYGKKQYEDAIRYLEMVKNASLFNRDYLLALGDSYYQMKNCQKVCEVFSQLNTKKASQATLKKILRPLGECYEKTNDPVKAAEAYGAYAVLPGVADADAFYLRAFLREKTDPKSAEALYLANIKAYPKDARSYVRLGMMYAENTATLSKAVEPLNQASMITPKDVSILLKLAQIWSALKNEDRELEMYNKLLTQEPQNLDANRRAGTLLMKKKQYSKAIESLEIVRVTNPQDAEIMLMLSEGYLKTNRKDKGVELLAKVQTMRKENPELMFQLYSIYKELGKNAEAENMIKQLIALKKENKYRILHANDLIEQKRYDEAKFFTDEIIKSDPMNLDGLMLSGRILTFQKKYDNAIESFKMASYVNANYAPAHYERGEIYRRQNLFDRAESFYAKALKADPKFGLAELGLARIYKAQNNVAEYASHLNKAKSLDPENREIMAEVKEKEPAASPKPKP
ncbi:MAG: tetratricopeptide repeat protein [Chitinispirillaceae bacterium]|nr:tetratricopeptide repeat protein [Chitinispirillaceae bacterium]